MKKKTIIVLLIAAAAIAAAVALFAINRPDEIAVTTTQTIENPETAQTEALEAADAEPVQAEPVRMEAEAEEVAEVIEMYGKITEITEEYVMISHAELGDVQVMLTEDTIIEGVEALQVGQTAKVLYTGMMTRSLPPQITALLVGVYAVTGEVTEAGEGRVTIAGETGDVIVTLPEGAAAPAVGDVITAYTTGVSTMSLPPQMNAVAIETAEAVG